MTTKAAPMNMKMRSCCQKTGRSLFWRASKKEGVPLVEVDRQGDLGAIGSEQAAAEPALPNCPLTERTKADSRPLF